MSKKQTLNEIAIKNKDLIEKKYKELMQIEELYEKINKLKQLLLLTDPSVSDITVGHTQILQWQEFIRCFPDEGEK